MVIASQHFLCLFRSRPSFLFIGSVAAAENRPSSIKKLHVNPEWRDRAGRHGW